MLLDARPLHHHLLFSGLNDPSEDLSCRFLAEAGTLISTNFEFDIAQHPALSPQSYVSSGPNPAMVRPVLWRAFFQAVLHVYF
jgi:hypothetical protein